MVESKDNGFSAIMVELIAGLPPESNTTIKYIVGLATILGKPALATRSHVAPKPYCLYCYGARSIRRMASSRPAAKAQLEPLRLLVSSRQCVYSSHASRTPFVL